MTALNRFRRHPGDLFLVCAAAALVCIAAFTAWLGLGLGGVATTVAVDDIGEAVASALAALACAFAALRVTGRSRLGWSLLSASALTWTVGEVVWCVYELGMGRAVPFPSPADIGFLLAIPLGIAGLLALPLAPSRRATRARSVLDGAIVAFSLLFVSWLFVLGTIDAGSGSGEIAQVVGLAYPIGDVLTVSVVILIASRAAGSERLRFLLLLGGFLANAVADSTFAFLTGAGVYTQRGSMFDASWVAGFLLIALAAVWPTTASSATDEGPIRRWQVTLPGMAFAGAMIGALVFAAGGRPLAANLTLLLGCLGLLLICSHLLSLADAADLSRVNGVAEAMLKRLDVPLDRLPLSGFLIDARGRLALAQSPMMDRLRRSGDAITAASSGGGAAPVSTGSPRLLQLEQEVHELQRVNEILRRLSAFDRQGEEAPAMVTSSTRRTPS